MQSEFERLYLPTRSKALSLAYRLTGNRDDAHDLLQEGALRAFRAFAQYDPDKPFLNWFSTILHHLWFDTLRKRKARPVHLSLDKLIADVGDSCPAFEEIDSDPAQSFLRRERGEHLLALLHSHLPAYAEQSVILADVYAYSYDEIAAITRTTIGTVRSRIHRGRSALKRSFRDSAHGSDPLGRLPY